MEKTRTVVVRIADITHENIHRPHWALPSVLDNEGKTIISIHRNICLRKLVFYRSLKHLMYVHRILTSSCIMPI